MLGFWKSLVSPAGYIHQQSLPFQGARKPHSTIYKAFLARHKCGAPTLRWCRWIFGCAPGFCRRAGVQGHVGIPCQGTVEKPCEEIEMVLCKGMIRVQQVLGWFQARDKLLYANKETYVCLNKATCSEYVI